MKANDGVGLTTEQLLNNFSESLALYDRYLVEAYDLPTKITDEKARLYAREKVRQSGKEDPEVLRWRLRAKFSAWMAVEP